VGCSCWVDLSLPSPPSAPGPTFGPYVARVCVLEPKPLQVLERGFLEQVFIVVPFCLQLDGVIVREAWRQQHTSCSCRRRIDCSTDRQHRAHSWFLQCLQGQRHHKHKHHAPSFSNSATVLPVTLTRASHADAPGPDAVAMGPAYPAIKENHCPMPCMQLSYMHQSLRMANVCVRDACRWGGRAHGAFAWGDDPHAMHEPCAGDRCLQPRSANFSTDSFACCCSQLPETHLNPGVRSRSASSAPDHSL
jgi:hypothetical protein